MKYATLLTLSATAAMALLLAGCGQTAADTQAEAKALRDNETQWNQDYAAKDADKVAAHYADTAVLMTPGAPLLDSKENIHKFLAEMLKDPALTLKFQASRAEVSKSGDMGYTQGSYTMTMTDPNTKQVINDHGSYVTTYAKQADGSWKAVADIATSDVPPPAPAPPAAGKKK